MPIYVYKCKTCGHQFELRQPYGAPPPEKCPRDGCPGPVVKVFTPPAIIFKGPGFHVTDYGRGSTPKKRDGDGEAKSGEKESGSGSEHSSGSSAD